MPRYCLLVWELSLAVQQPRSSMAPVVELTQPQLVVQKHWWVSVLLLVALYQQQELLVGVAPHCRMADQVDLEDLEVPAEHWQQV